VPQAKEVTLQPDGKDMYGRTLPMCSYLMALTSTTPSSKTPGAGGIGSMRWGIQCWKAQFHRCSPAYITDWDALPVVTA